jgi:hypothetical protein
VRGGVYRRSRVRGPRESAAVTRKRVTAHLRGA